MTKQNILEQYKRMGKNFMTPNVKSYILTEDNRIVELSSGTDFEGKVIYSVSEFKNGDYGLETTKRGQMHRSLKSAKKHFNILLGAF